MKYLIYHASSKTWKKAVISDYHIVLTTYETLKADVKPQSVKSQGAHQPALGGIGWLRVVLDEGKYHR